MRVLLLALLLLPLSGCFAPSPMELDSLSAGTVDAGPAWMTHTEGCGFCGGTDAPWATTLVLGADGQVLWFSFRPSTNMPGDPQKNETGVVLPEGSEALRERVVEAVVLLAKDDIYWTDNDAVKVYEIHNLAVAANDWPELKERLGQWADGIEDTPTDFTYGCDDCGSSNVQVVAWSSVVYGNVVPMDGHGNGNVRIGSQWDLLERQLDHLHRLAEAEAS